jgi:periplasmic divalent cation tolerance protein
MNKKQEFALVLVTAPDRRTARMLAQAALKARLVACANLLPGIESHYWWQGKIEIGAETLVLFKTTSARLTALEKLILDKHPYDTPEFVVLPFNKGTRRYLDWLKQACQTDETRIDTNQQNVLTTENAKVTKKRIVRNQKDLHSRSRSAIG